MIKIINIIKPFALQILMKTIIGSAVVMLLGIGARMVFSIPSDLVYSYTLVFLGLFNFILAPIFSKAQFSENISWLLNLPLKKSQLVLLHVLQSLSGILIGVFIFLISLPIASIISFGVSNSAKEESQLKIYELSKLALSKIDFSLGTDLSTITSIFFLVIAYLLYLGVSLNKQSFVQRQMASKSQVPLREKMRNFILSLKGINGIILLLFIFIRINKISLFSPINICILLSLTLPIAWIVICKQIVYESRNAKLIKKGLFSFVLLTQFIAILISRANTLDKSIDITERIATFKFLGYFAPPIQNELLAEIKEKKLVNVDSVPLLLSNTENRMELFLSLLEVPYMKKNKSILKGLSNELGLINPNSHPPRKFMTGTWAKQFRQKLKFYDLKKLSHDGLFDLLDGYHHKYKSPSYQLCNVLSRRVMSKEDLSRMIHSIMPATKRCGLILIRYYPEFDLTTQLAKYANKTTHLNKNELSITYTAITGKPFPPRELTLEDWRPIEVTCPASGDGYIKSFDKLNFATQMRCARRYLRRRPFKTVGLDSTNFYLRPGSELLTYFEIEYKKEKSRKK